MGWQNPFREILFWVRCLWRGIDTVARDLAASGRHSWKCPEKTQPKSTTWVGHSSVSFGRVGQFLLQIETRTTQATGSQHSKCAKSTSTSYVLRRKKKEPRNPHPHCDPDPYRINHPVESTRIHRICDFFTSRSIFYPLDSLANSIPTPARRRVLL